MNSIYPQPPPNVRGKEEPVKLWLHFKSWWREDKLPRHLQYGRLGEQAARKHLRRAGLKFLMANFRTRRGEVDLIFRDGDCLVFVEVKTRSSEEWNRPASAINAAKRRHLTRTAFAYLRLIEAPPTKVRFDIVEVLLRHGEVNEIRHLSNGFPLSPPFRYG